MIDNVGDFFRFSSISKDILLDLLFLGSAEA